MDIWQVCEIDPTNAPRSVREYLDTLDGEAFEAATTAKAQFIAHADPASQWAATRKGPAFFTYSDTYLVEKDHRTIVFKYASQSNKTAEVGALRKTLDRTDERFGVTPDWIAADTACGPSANLVRLPLKRQNLTFQPLNFVRGSRIVG